ncbi:MAG: hypothetical protein JSR80_06440 [Verrucomicrobia bacterium]|nr:hypothetical protein [Verrucomicrobiota bacterium]
MDSIKVEDVAKAATHIGLTDYQAESLRRALQEIQNNKPKFNTSVVLLYLGSLIAFLSMTLFYLSNLDDSSSLVISTSYALIFFGSGAYFWYVKKLRRFGGMLAALGIVMVPLIVYWLQTLLNWWPTHPPGDYRSFYHWAHGEWVPMEICTLMVAGLVLYFIRFPFITAIIYFVIWYISMDITQLLTGTQNNFFLYYSKVSVIIGSVLTILGFGLHWKNQEDFGFWSYLFGMFLCWTGLTLWEKPTELGFFTYFLINCAFLLLSGFFHRKIFMLFGSLGVVYYIGHLAYIFLDSWMFSYVLGAVGFAIIIIAAFFIRGRASCQIRS